MGTSTEILLLFEVNPLYEIIYVYFTYILIIWSISKHV